jgi:hypothetical protein
MDAYQHEQARRMCGGLGLRPGENVTPGVFEAHRAWLDGCRKEAVGLGLPGEAYTPEAFYWDYVLGTRREYQNWLQQGEKPGDLGPQYTASRSSLPSNLVTEPLTEEQMREANAWKIAYLQRLRRENTDESYISAYMAYWKLSEANVFPTNGP